ncbi:MAG: hypothetical protein JW722_00665 [Demequinaceae bacterium]|nr:hypothetical protein [Demequinaceae bacterium]
MPQSLPYDYRGLLLDTRIWECDGFLTAHTALRAVRRMRLTFAATYVAIAGRLAASAR